MHGSETPAFGNTEAEQISVAGWRQGVPFQVPASLQIDAAYDAVTEWLVICTQSCTVVSPSLENDPAVEVVIGKILGTFNPKSREATGRNVRRFQFPVTGIPGVEAFECNINRRFSFPREKLLQFRPPEGVMVSAKDAKNLAGWISRYYTRIALPDELVRRSKIKGGLFDRVRKALNQKMDDGEPVYTAIDGIFIRWEPGAEPARLSYPSDPYRLDLIFLCERGEADTLLGESLTRDLEQFTDDAGHDGLEVMFDTRQTSQTFVSELSAYNRLSEWDYFSNLADVAESCHKLSPCV